MKYTSFILICILLTGFLASGQTYLSQDFSSNQMPPAGWSINGMNDQWSISQSNNAGGIAPEANFTYGTGTDTQLISPVIDLTGLTSVHLAFTHYYDWYTNPAPKLGVATRSGSSGTWHTVWQISPFGDLGPSQMDLEINNSDVGSAGFQFCFFLTGNMYNLDNWFLDNVILINPVTLNGALASINQTPVYFSNPAEVRGVLENVGSGTINTAEIDWRLDGGDVHVTTLTGLSVPTFGTTEFTCDELMDAPIGMHKLTVWLNSVNGAPDPDPGNDTLSKTVNKVCYSVPRRPIFEEFTSSTCLPCAFFNTSFVPWCDSHEDNIAVIKYQMNWPGAGDPYYTAEGGVRRDYYGVTWVPWLECDGKYVNTNMGAVQNAFGPDSSEVARMNIVATHTFNDHVITVNATVLPFSNFPGSRLYVAVVEKTTYNNTGSNGENSFDHVMMKMIPDAVGTFVNLADRTPFTYTATVDLTETHIERWDDLLVELWVQNGFTKEIYQSAYSVENGILNTENRLNDIRVDGNSINGFSPDNFNYNYGVPEGTSLVPLVQAVPIDSTEIVIVIPTATIPGTTTIDAFAQNNVAHNQYAVNFFYTTGIDDPGICNLAVYPNPASGFVYISGATHARISLHSTPGATVKQIKDFTGDRLDLSGLTNGVYMLKLEMQGKATITRKIVVAGDK
ncbi:MAG: T9SS type A sorting domain-containing protein [Bacteroidetes bacterium]|nr:T9SS type A sorting domain-containing protein [Bacteroidota bacterium]